MVLPKAAFLAAWLKMLDHVVACISAVEMADREKLDGLHNLLRARFERPGSESSPT